MNTMVFKALIYNIMLDKLKIGMKQKGQVYKGIFILFSNFKL